MKNINIIIILLLCISCNSEKNKNNTFSYSNKQPQISQDTNASTSISRGKAIYTTMCVVCHMTNGKGVPKAFPPLANSDYLKENQEKSIIGIKKGMSGKIIVNGITYNSVMSPLGLTDEEVADVMNYINNSWGNNYGEIITSEDVTKVIKKQ
ncbi:c-type cytochrome [Winogradskyella sp.]|uniref:c-type cytochrome n=1 Tax=Winogradskyella sp. TaxID=1883156 RepID=UPI003F6D71C0